MGNVCVFSVTFDANVAFVAQTLVKYLDGSKHVFRFSSMVTELASPSLRRHRITSVTMWPIILCTSYHVGITPSPWLGLKGHFMMQLDVVNKERIEFSLTSLTERLTTARLDQRESVNSDGQKFFKVTFVYVFNFFYPSTGEPPLAPTDSVWNQNTSRSVRAGSSFRYNPGHRGLKGGRG